MSASAVHAGCSAPGTAALTFEWVPKTTADPSLGSVHVKDASGKIVQVLDNLENYHADNESLRTGRDFNNDGCADLVVVNSVAPIGNESVTAFLYNPRTKRFDMSKALSDIGGLDLDLRDRNCVTGSWKGGAEDMAYSRYCWSKGKLLLTYAHSITPLYHREGGFACYEHIETDYRGGKKRERRRCTKAY